MQNVKSGIGLTCDFTGKIFCQDRKAEDRCGSHAADDRPNQIRGHRQAQDERELSRNEYRAYCREHDLRANVIATQSLSQDAEEQSSDTQCESHHEKMMHDLRTVEFLDVCEPRPRPQSLQRPRRADADGRKRSHSPETLVRIDLLQAAEAVLSLRLAARLGR